MTQIIEKKELSLGIKSLTLLSPLISRKSKPGQFVVLRVNDQGERIPLTIADADSKKGNITIIFQEVGKTTKDLGKLVTGDHVLDLVGPLGTPSDIQFFGTVIIVAGGVGVAEAYPIAKALKKEGNKVITIISKHFLP